MQISAFYMDKYKVTKALWDEVKAWNGGNGYDYTGTPYGKAANHPVCTVNWYDCVKWCNARSQKEGRTPCYYTDAGLTVYLQNRSGDGAVCELECEWVSAADGSGVGEGGAGRGQRASVSVERHGQHFAQPSELLR